MSFVSKVWKKGDPITHQELNRLEAGIKSASSFLNPVKVEELGEGATKADIIKKVNELIEVMKTNGLIK